MALSMYTHTHTHTHHPPFTLPFTGASGVIKDFSAVCYMTVRDIARMHTGTRPMALIQSAWGGTRVEAWMSTGAIAAASKRVVPGQTVIPPVKSGPNKQSVLFNAMVRVGTVLCTRLYLNTSV